MTVWTLGTILLKNVPVFEFVHSVWKMLFITLCRMRLFISSGPSFVFTSSFVCVLPLFASSSAISFPSIPQCDGIQILVTLYPLISNCSCNSIMFWIMSNLACFLLGSLRDWAAERESVSTRTSLSFPVLEASDNAP